MPKTSVRCLVERAENAARVRLEHERSLNRLIEHRRSGIRPTARYLMGPLSSFHPRFGSELDVLAYEIKREMGKYDEEVVYPTN